MHTFVRKTAHFTEYAVLGFFTYKAVSCDVKDRKKAVLMAQLISTGYASTDEIHQMFVPGREGKVFDVMIDSCGAFCGIMVSLITQKFIEIEKGNLFLVVCFPFFFSINFCMIKDTIIPQNALQLSIITSNSFPSRPGTNI